MINLALESRYVIDAFDTLFIVIPNCNCAEQSPKCTLTNLPVDSLSDRIVPMRNHATQFDHRSWQGTVLFGGTIGESFSGAGSKGADGHGTDGTEWRCEAGGGAHECNALRAISLALRRVGRSFCVPRRRRKKK